MSKYYLQIRYDICNDIIDIFKVDSYHGVGTLDLRSITGGFLNDTLAPEEIGLALLPASLFENIADDEIGLFFSLYESATFFPVADVPSTTTVVGVITRIGSPVVAATVVTAEQTSFPDLREPVIVAVRLNPVLEGVSCARFYLLNTSSLNYAFISPCIAEYYTLHVCILGFQPCR